MQEQPAVPASLQQVHEIFTRETPIAYVHDVA